VNGIRKTNTIHYRGTLILFQWVAGVARPEG
jgi:hypothetical protein